ncbi:MAG: fructose-6-phosphate aldolase [Lachnospiraceae bacterium]|nr:fructose-6-phosphate aldolase [Lachnospiraceae bacterium]
MKLFADTADLRELTDLEEMGLLAGITTNPSIASKEGPDVIATITALANRFPTIPVLAQVVAVQKEEILEEAKKIGNAGENVAVKIPATLEGVKAIRTLKELGIKTCATTVLTSAQAMLCAHAGASYVAPYTGQNDCIGYHGLDTLREIANVFANADYHTEILAASIEKPQEFVDYALNGADITTAPYHVFVDVFRMPMPLTQHYIDNFYADWTANKAYLKESRR